MNYQDFVNQPKFRQECRIFGNAVTWLVQPNALRKNANPRLSVRQTGDPRSPACGLSVYFLVSVFNHAAKVSSSAGVPLNWILCLAFSPFLTIESRSISLFSQPLNQATS